jgi:hypothetical protein
LLSKKLTLVSKKPLKVLKQLNVNQDFSTSSTTLSSFKDSGSDYTNVSLYNIKKSVKLANKEFVDGFTNIKTICPVCDPKENPEDIYINKTTGNL